MSEIQALQQRIEQRASQNLGTYLRNAFSAVRSITDGVAVSSKPSNMHASEVEGSEEHSISCAVDILRDAIEESLWPSFLQAEVDRIMRLAARIESDEAEALAEEESDA